MIYVYNNGALHNLTGITIAANTNISIENPYYMDVLLNAQ